MFYNSLGQNNSHHVTSQKVNVKVDIMIFLQIYNLQYFWNITFDLYLIANAA